MGPRPGRRGGGTQKSSVGGPCDKSSSEIVAWLRTLPESHVPEQTREEVVKIVEADRLDGGSFTGYVQTIPPEVCAPKHAMKLKAAWKNVLMEAEAKAICRQNLDYAEANPGKQAVAIKVL